MHRKETLPNGNYDSNAMAAQHQFFEKSLYIRNSSLFNLLFAKKMIA